MEEGSKRPAAETHASDRSWAFDAARGWCVIDNLIACDESAEIVEACRALLALPAAQRFARDDAHSGTQHLERLDERLAPVADLVARPALTDAVAAAQHQPAAPLTLDQATYRNPRPGFGAQALHLDDVTERAHDYVTVIVALVEFTPTNGATRVITASHRRPDLWRTATTHATHRDETLLVGPAGTAFILAGGLLHAGTRNESSHERPALQLIWRVEPTSHNNHPGDRGRVVTRNQQRWS